ncbi:MAG: ATP-binding cassette domain-containing protein, partial [Pirellulales bacterium]|nr:ATP-binding cassette domain-containing protein [Pirellulales bacterium]
TVSADVLVRAESLLDRVGLAARRMHLPSELSGGERQRVAVARSLILSPRLILADEPTGNLDTHSSEMITELLVELASEIMGMLVVVTHSQTVADRMGSIARLNDGRLLRL